MFYVYERLETEAVMRPYVPGEDLTGISVSDNDQPELQSSGPYGFIARAKDDPNDRWYVSRGYAEKVFNLQPVREWEDPIAQDDNGGPDAA